VKKFLAFYGARRFIATFTSPRHLTLSWARSIQSIPSAPSHFPKIHLRFTKGSVQVLGTFVHFVTRPVFTVYQRISPGPRHICPFRNKASFYGGELLASRPTPASWRATSCLLSATGYSIYSQLPSILGEQILHPQLEDAPCRGDRDPRNVGKT